MSAPGIPQATPAPATAAELLAALREARDVCAEALALAAPMPEGQKHPFIARLDDVIARAEVQP